MHVINVTKPELPPLSELMPLLEGIWESGVVTNGGNCHKLFEGGLKHYLGVKNLSLFNNATIGLLATIKAFDLKGEVITTPYSFVATTHALAWNNIKPVFADVCMANFNICPIEVEKRITENTSAILAVHCYGNPCDIDSLQRLADKYRIKLVFDAAHAFGVKFKGKSITEFGDASILSFHGTKVFNTFEGGAVVSSDAGVVLKLEKLKNFGFTSETTVEAVGINGKMSEFNAALGLAQLQHVDNYVSRRKAIYEYYLKALRKVPGLMMPFDGVNQATIQNYGYFPIRVTSRFGVTRDELYQRLKEIGINTRRYFYPIISDFDPYRAKYSVKREYLRKATKLAEEVLCLPIYPALTKLEMEKVAEGVRAFGSKHLLKRQRHEIIQSDEVKEIYRKYLAKNEY
jgi:dTDP-4-amino-4,6-dideoxygalactose transaminase